ncbi:MAG: methylated-DNA--[protein]-cysteine S-methyltransferase [Candidatus Aminicenantes bacterium]|nr:methylated-DNA--[protein]-cysteine S-methyltransferase [Candidatus Aminicenantes bacterium]
MKNVYKEFCETPLGYLEVKATEKGILAVHFIEEKRPWKNEGTPEILSKCIHQLKEYFDGKRKIFTVDLILQGTDFQKKVWEKMLNIPYGQTSSYGEIAAKVGKPKAARAVGAASGSNHIGIIIPCHRVIGANGDLVGFGGGLWRKKMLLELEQKYL